MIYIKCLDKFRDKNGVITHYKLMNTNKQISVVESKELKSRILNKEWFVVNLKLTSDGRLIDRPAEELNEQTKRLTKSSNDKKRLTTILDKLLNSTILKVLKEHGINYETKYSDIYNNSKIYADIKITSFNLYYTYMDNYTGDTITQKNKFRVITVELVQESSFIYKVTVYTSLSTTEFSAKKIPKLKHEFIINNKEQSIKGIYGHEEYVYDKDKGDDVVTYTVVNRDYKNTQESLADIDEYLANWLSKYLNQQEEDGKSTKLPASVTNIQLDKAIKLVDSICKWITYQGFNIINRGEPLIGSNYNLVTTPITVRSEDEDTKVVFELKQYLNRYADTKIEVYLKTISITNDVTFNMRFNQRDFEKGISDSKREITANKFMSLIVSFIQDYITYRNWLDKIIIPTIKENLGNALATKIITDKGVLDKLSETSNEVTRAHDICKTTNGVKLGVLNNYLNNDSIRFYIKFNITADCIANNGTDLDKTVYIGLTFSDKGIYIGDIESECVNDKYDPYYGEDSKYNSKYTKLPVISGKLCNISKIRRIGYILNREDLQSVLSRDALFKRLGLTELKLHTDGIKSLIEISNNKAIQEYDYALTTWVDESMGRITEVINNLFGNTRQPIEKRTFEYIIKDSYRTGYAKISLLNLLNKATLAIAEHHNNKILLAFINDKAEDKDCEVSQLYPTVNVNDIDKVKNAVKEFNEVSDEINKTADYVVNTLINGTKKIEEQLQKLEEIAKNLGISIDAEPNITVLDFGLNAQLILRINNELSNRDSNIVSLKFEDWYDNKAYKTDLCYTVIDKASKLIKEYTNKKLFTYELWFSSTIEIIKNITDFIEEEQLKAGLNTFKESEDSNTRNIENLENIENIESDFDWL